VEFHCETSAPQEIINPRLSDLEKREPSESDLDGCDSDESEEGHSEEEEYTAALKVSKEMKQASRKEACCGLDENSGGSRELGKTS